MLRAKLRVFSAPDDVSGCERYSRSHREVLEYFDIAGVTSSGGDWFADPNVLVALLEEEGGGEALAGIRLERAGSDRPLPIERALSGIDPAVRSLTRAKVSGGTAEVCALFSARQLRGGEMGPFLTRVGLAIAVERGIGKVFGVCDTRSLEPNLRLGFRVEVACGDRGSFRYPRADLTAYALSAELAGWRTPGRPEHELIREFRESPVGTVLRSTRRGDLRIEWDLCCSEVGVSGIRSRPVAQWTPGPKQSY